MILEQLGMLADAQAISGDGYVGYCIDLVSAVGDPGVSMVWLNLTTNVAADHTTGDEKYNFQIRCGTGTDDTDLNAGVITIIETGDIDGDDARVASAGAAILQCTLPYQANLQYLELYCDVTGTTPTITVDFSLSPSKPRSPYNRQVTTSPVGVP